MRARIRRRLRINLNMIRFSSREKLVVDVENLPEEEIFLLKMKKSENRGFSKECQDKKFCEFFAPKSSNHLQTRIKS